MLFSGMSVMKLRGNNILLRKWKAVYTAAGADYFRNIADTF
jgi:hypothetical protein